MQLRAASESSQSHSVGVSRIEGIFPRDFNTARTGSDDTLFVWATVGEDHVAVAVLGLDLNRCRADGVLFISSNSERTFRGDERFARIGLNDRSEERFEFPFFVFRAPALKHCLSEAVGDLFLDTNHICLEGVDTGGVHECELGEFPRGLWVEALAEH